MLTYTLPIYFKLPRSFYDPLHRRWMWTANVGPIPMGYLGQIEWAIAGAILAGGSALTSRGVGTPSMLTVTTLKEYSPSWGAW